MYGVLSVTMCNYMIFPFINFFVSICSLSRHPRACILSKDLHFLDIPCNGNLTLVGIWSLASFILYFQNLHTSYHISVLYSLSLLNNVPFYCFVYPLRK